LFERQQKIAVGRMPLQNVAKSFNHFIGRGNKGVGALRVEVLSVLVLEVTPELHMGPFCFPLKDHTVFA